MEKTTKVIAASIDIDLMKQVDHMKIDKGFRNRGDLVVEALKEYLNNHGGENGRKENQ